MIEGEVFPNSIFQIQVSPTKGLDTIQFFLLDDDWMSGTISIGFLMSNHGA
jgi:hypothetical protein